MSSDTERAMTALTVSDPTSQQGAPTEAEQPSLELEKHTRPLAPGEPKPKKDGKRLW